VRHLVWSASLAGSLALALSFPWVPRMNVPIRGWSVLEEAAMRGSMPAPSNASLPVTQRFSELAVGAEVDTAYTTMRDATADRRTPLWLLAWMTGATFILSWGVIGRLGLARMARRATPATDGSWQSSVADAARTFGVTRPIRILVSDRVGAPVTWGFRRPVLVVPTASEAWSEDVRRSVAAHEVAHIARNDYLHQLVALAACAVYWFHPLAWALVRRMRLTAERACDDLVLAQGTTGEDYAAHLIGVARGSRALRLAGAVAIGMARPSTLEGRIVAVLDSTRQRGEPTHRMRRATVAATGVALAALGCLRPVPASARVLADVPGPAPASAPGAVSASPEVVIPGGLGGSKPGTAASNTAQESTPRRTGVHQDTVEEVTASPGEELELDLDAGGSVTIRGWDENRVQVRAHLDGEDWRDVDIRIDRQSGGVLVSARPARSRNTQRFNNRFDIRVPRRFDVRIASAGGSLTLIDVQGRFTGHTGGGGFTLERLSGSASLTTGGGEVRVSDSNLSGRVSTGGGLVRLSRVSGGLRGSSGSGPVIHGESGSGSNETSDLSGVQIGRRDGSISIGRNTTYRAGSLVIDKAGGNIDLNAAPNGARVHTGGGDVHVGEAGGDVSATTGGGDVSVGPAAGSVKASTGAGDVHIIVDRSSRDQHIEARSGKGKVIIELPRDFQGRLELETAHTRTHEATARIRSDFEIDREPLTDWDERQGTARRYLRATARIGRGDARVVVRTVNGEIEIRRR
jgi:beta-lactamase regulating signal transducer with metallopeptidase domain